MRASTARKNMKHDSRWFELLWKFSDISINRAGGITTLQTKVEKVVF
jgi:hypothetical protein